MHLTLLSPPHFNFCPSVIGATLCARYWAVNTRDFADQRLYAAFLAFQADIQQEKVLSPYGLDILSAAVMHAVEASP